MVFFYQSSPLLSFVVLCCPAPSRMSGHTGVSRLERHGKTKWQVAHEDLPSAKRAKAEAERATAEAKAAKKEEPKKTVAFKGVVKLGCGLFQAQAWDSDASAMGYLGTGKTAEAAANLIVKHKGVKSRSIITVAKTKRYKSDEVVERFKMLIGIYTDPDGSPAVMSDLTSSAQNRSAYPLLGVHAPALYFMSLMGKDGPWKAALAQTWASVFQGSANASAYSQLSLQSLDSLLSMKTIDSIKLRSLQMVEAESLTATDMMAMAQILQVAAARAWQADRTEWDLNVNYRKLYFMGWQRLVKGYYPMFHDRDASELKPLSKSVLSNTIHRLRAAHAAGELCCPCCLCCQQCQS